MSKNGLTRYVIRSNQIEGLRPPLRHPLFFRHLAAAVMVSIGSHTTIITPQQIHAVLMCGLLPGRRVGCWRTNEVCVGDREMPLASMVPGLMREYEEERKLIEGVYRSQRYGRDDLKLLIDHHFERGLIIHPFPDGNGRTFRLYYNSLLQHYGFPWCQFGERGYEWIDRLLQLRHHEVIFKKAHPGLYSRRPVTP